MDKTKVVVVSLLAVLGVAILGLGVYFGYNLIMQQNAATTNTTAESDLVEVSDTTDDTDDQSLQDLEKELDELDKMVNELQ